MTGLLCFVVAVLASPFKSKLRLEAENAVRVDVSAVLADIALSLFFLAHGLLGDCTGHAC
jgi:hypothetical protein